MAFGSSFPPARGAGASSGRLRGEDGREVLHARSRLVTLSKGRLMDPRTEPLCICGHMEGYHSGVSHEIGGGWYRCCKGFWPKTFCRCPRFRLAITEPSDIKHVENPGRP